VKEDPDLVELLLSDHSVNSDHRNTTLGVNVSGTSKNTNPGEPDILPSLKYAEQSLNFCD